MTHFRFGSNAGIQFEVAAIVVAVSNYLLFAVDEANFGLNFCGIQSSADCCLQCSASPHFVGSSWELQFLKIDRFRSLSRSSINSSSSSLETQLGVSLWRNRARTLPWMDLLAISNRGQSVNLAQVLHHQSVEFQDDKLQCCYLCQDCDSRPECYSDCGLGA